MGNCYSAPKFTKMVSLEDLDLTKIMRAMSARLASPDGAGSNRVMKLELGIMAGANTKEFLVSMESILARFEAVADKLSGASSPVMLGKSLMDDGTTDEAVEDETDFAPPAKKQTRAKKQAAPASFDDAEEEVEAEETEEESFAEPAPKKVAKEKKLTVDDVNAACMKAAQSVNRAHVLGILKTKFKVKSVTELEPAQYAAVIKALG